MLGLKKSSKLQKYTILATLTAVFGTMTLFIVYNTANDNSRSNGGLYPPNGSYKITETQGMQCMPNNPATCSGSILLSSEEQTRYEANLDSDTKVRYQSKEVQIYPADLQKDMTGRVVFKPNSATIETMTIAD